jgi:predicted transcriptional regulator
VLPLLYHLAGGGGAVLEVLGVDQWGEEAYIALVNGPPLSVDELAVVTTIARDMVPGVLQRLEDRGLLGLGRGGG